MPYLLSTSKFIQTNSNRYSSQKKKKLVIDDLTIKLTNPKFLTKLI